MLKLKSIKLKSRNYLISNFDNNFEECYNSFVSIVPEYNQKQFVDFIIALFENKQNILMAEGEPTNEKTRRSR